MGKGAKTPGPTAQEVALAEISRKQLDRYSEVFAPFEDEWLTESRVSSGEKGRLAGQIGGDVEQAFAVEGRRGGGMDPGGMRDLAVAKAKSKAGAQASGTVRAENADVSALMSGVRLGRGQAVEAAAGMGEMAAVSVSESINKALTKQAKSDATADMVGSGLGVLAYGASGMGKGVSDAELVKNGGSVGARNASRQVGMGMVP